MTEVCPEGPSDSIVRCALSLSACNQRSEIFSRLNFSLLPSMATTVSATRCGLQEGMMRGVRKLPQLRLGPLQPLCRTSLPSLVLRLPRLFFVTLQVVRCCIPSFKPLSSLAKWPLDEIHQLAGPSGAGLGAIQHICSPYNRKRKTLVERASLILLPTSIPLDIALAICNLLLWDVHAHHTEP